MPSPAAEEQETQLELQPRVNTPSTQAQNVDLNEPPPSGQPGQDEFMSQYANDDSEIIIAVTQQDSNASNATSFVEETQFVGLEIDTQAPEDRFSPAEEELSPMSRKFLNEANGQLREVPDPVSQPQFARPTIEPAFQTNFFSRPTEDPIEDIGAGFKFGAAIKPKGGSYSRPAPGNPAEAHPVQTSSSVPVPPKRTENSQSAAQKVTEKNQAPFPSRGGRSRSLASTRPDSSLINQVTAPIVSHENISRPPVVVDSVQKTISTKGNKSRKRNTPTSGVPRTDTSLPEYASPQQVPQVRNPVPQTRSAAPKTIPTPPTSNGPKSVLTATKLPRSAVPPFANLARDTRVSASVQNSSATPRGGHDTGRRGSNERRESHRIEHEDQATSYSHEQQQQVAPKFQARQDTQYFEVDRGRDESPVRADVQYSEHQEADLHRQAHRRPSLQEMDRDDCNSDSSRTNVQHNGPSEVDLSRQARRRPPFADVDRHNGATDFPDGQVNEPEQPNHRQVHQLPPNQIVNRPLPAAQLQPQNIPYSIPGKSRGVTKNSKSRSKARTPEVANRNAGPSGPLKANAKPNTADLFQMLMFMAHTEQEQFKEAELKVKDQQSKLERLVDENFALHREVGSLQGEKNRLDSEFLKLKSKSEYYKTHINEVTRSQKHLEGLILKSNEKQDLLLREIEEKENAARKQVEEAGAQVEIFRSSLAVRVEAGLTEARHQYDMLQQSHEQLKKELDKRALELQTECGRAEQLQKRVDDCQPAQEVLLQKLQEHFENVNQQLSSHEGKLSSIVSGEETTKSKFDECLTILNTVKDKETPEPLALGELLKMVDTLTTSIENRMTSEGETQSNLREEGRGLLDDLKERIEAIRTDQKAQEALTDRISSLREANAGLTEKFQAVEVELSELRNQHLSLKGEFDACRGHLTATKEELSRTLALPREDPAIHGQIQELQNTNVSLLSQVDTISKDFASAKEQLALQQVISKSQEEQCDTLRNKLRDAENLVSGFNDEKAKYEHAKTEESIQLRKELETTLTQKLAEQNFSHENTELSLKRAKVTAEKKLTDALADLKKSKESYLAASEMINTLRADLETAKTGKEEEAAKKVAAEKKLSNTLADLEKSKASCLAATGLTSQLRGDLETAEISRDEQAAAIDTLEEDLDAFTERYGSLSNEIQLARGEILQYRQLITETENQAVESSELVQKVKDEAVSEIGKLKEQIANMEERHQKSKKLIDVFDRYLSSRGKKKDGQDLQQWANEWQAEPQELPSQEKSVPRVSFQDPVTQKESSGVGQQSLSSKTALQSLSAPHPSRSGRPRIAERKSSIQSVVNPSHMSGLDNMLMQRSTEVTEFSVRTSKTYESHRNTEIDTSTSPMTDLEPVFADRRNLETGQGMEKALKKQRSIKPAHQVPGDGGTRVQVPKVPTSKAEEASRRREKQTPKSAMKRSRSESTPQNSSQGDADSEVFTPSSSYGGQSRHPVTNNVLSSKSTNTPKGSAHAFGISPYNRIVSGNGASRQQHSATKSGYKSSTLSRQLSLNSTAVATKSSGNGDAHPAKLQRIAVPERRLSKTVIPDSQGESQISMYTPSQEL